MVEVGWFGTNQPVALSIVVTPVEAVASHIQRLCGTKRWRFVAESDFVGYVGPDCHDGTVFIGISKRP
jgi:hypothetical protein